MVIKFKTKFQSSVSLCLTIIHIVRFIGFYFVGIGLILASCEHQKHLENAGLKSQIDSLNIEFGKELTYDSLKLEEIKRLNEICDSANYPEGKINLYITASRIYMANYRHEKALEMLNKAQDALDETDDRELAAKVNFYFGKLNFRINNSDVALEYFLKAADLSKKANDSVLYANALSNIGNLYLERGNLEKGREYFGKSISINETTGNDEALSVDLHLMSVYYLRKGELDSAKYYFDREVKLSKESNNLRLYIYNLNNLASFQIENGDFENAEKNLFESLRLIDSISPYSPPTNSRSTIHANLGILYQKMEEYDKSLKHFNLANEDSLFNNVPEFRISLNHNLYQLHWQLKNYELSNYFLDRYLELREINDKVVADHNLMSMELKYNYRQLQREHEHKQRRMRLILIASLFIFGLGLLILILFIQKQRIKIRNSRLQKKLQDIQVERLNRELASQALNMVRINERKINLINTLRQRLPDFKRENQLIVSGIIDDFEKDKNELAWKEFETRFTEVHSDFYKKLSAINPNLTLNERRLCAFLFLDMTTKEISSITGQSIRAIEQARNRLRKQLNITNANISLNGFLTSI